MSLYGKGIFSFECFYHRCSLLGPRHNYSDWGSRTDILIHCLRPQKWVLLFCRGVPLCVARFLQYLLPVNSLLCCDGRKYTLSVTPERVDSAEVGTLCSPYLQFKVSLQLPDYLLHHLSIYLLWKVVSHAQDIWLQDWARCARFRHARAIAAAECWLLCLNSYVAMDGPGFIYQQVAL
jgi:hypothetical protein